MPKIQAPSIAVNAAEDWINDLMRRLGWRDRERVYRVLLATLHALRDSLARDEAVYVGAQLPPLLRGLYYGVFADSCGRIPGILEHLQPHCVPGAHP